MVRSSSRKAARSCSRAALRALTSLASRVWSLSWPVRTFIHAARPLRTCGARSRESARAWSPRRRASSRCATSVRWSMRSARPCCARARLAESAQSLPPRHDVLFLVPLPILLPEALRADGPGGQHDMGVRVLALAAVEGDIRDQVSRPSSEPPSASLQSAANRAPVAPRCRGEVRRLRRQSPVGPVEREPAPPGRRVRARIDGVVVTVDRVVGQDAKSFLAGGAVAAVRGAWAALWPRRVG